MIRRPPRSTRTYTLFPYTALFRSEGEGRTPILVGWDGAAKAVLVVSDTIKDTSAEAVGQLRELGLRPVLLTGDNERAASAVAAQVGIDEVIAEVLPEDKVNVRSEERRVGKECGSTCRSRCAS